MISGPNGKEDSRRPTLRDVAREANVSLATIDRLINDRTHVRAETAKRIIDAAVSIGYYGSELLKSRFSNYAGSKTFGFVIHHSPSAYYPQLTLALEEEVRSLPGSMTLAMIRTTIDGSPSTMERFILEVGNSSDVLGVVAADHPRVRRAIQSLHNRGKPVVALLSPINTAGCVGYVGPENQKAGRVAGWWISHLADRAGKVGLVIGSHRYQSHELRESGLRSYFREHAPEFRVLDTHVNLDDPRFSYEVTSNMLNKHPDLVGIYVAAGARGTLQALSDAEFDVKPVIVIHELTENVRSSIISGLVDVALQVPVTGFARAAVRTMLAQLENDGGNLTRQCIVPFDTTTLEIL